MAPNSSSTPLSAEDWVLVKALFARVDAAGAAEREAMLADPSVSAVVRHEVRSLIAAASASGGRFEPITPSSDSAPSDGAPAPLRDPDLADAPSFIGRRLGPFKVLRLIGRGGMGAVYEAERVDDGFHQRVAIKTLWRGVDSEVLLQRFRSERRILAVLQHPNIAQLLDGGSTVEGTPWLAMEYVSGLPIDRYCNDRALDIPARLDLFRDVCAAVQFAHRHLVVHRDIKPSNVMVNDDGDVKLLDFGVAKLLDDPRGEGTLTGAGLSPFTRAYAAPEQLAGDPVSTLTDVYALGVLLERLLADTTAGRAVAGELAAITQMAKRDDPDRRYASAAALSDDVLRFLRRDRVVARPDTMTYRLRAFVRRRRGLVVSVGSVMAVTVSSLIAIAWQARARSLEAQRSERAAEFLSRLVAGPDAYSSDALVRVGPQGTVAQLLDSALRQVPQQFADDARIRARLYTAIGANYSAQGRIRESVPVLDSAQQLAREAYGNRSAEFAMASLELSYALFRLDGPERADAPLRDALHALNAMGETDPDLQIRAMVALAMLRFAKGDVRAADSIANAAIAFDNRRGVGANMSRARAELTLAQTGSWLRRDPREYVLRCRRVARLTDALRARVSLERLAATRCEIEGLVTLGDIAGADSVMQSMMPGFQSAYGDTSMPVATLLGQAATIHGARGDVVGQHALASKAWDMFTRIPDVAAEELVGFAMMRVESAWAQKDWTVADSVARLAIRRVENQHVPVSIIFAYLYLGLTHLRQQHWTDAESDFRAGMNALPETQDLNSMLPRLRRALAESLDGQGRTHEADSVRALVPPRGSFPDCTPGGKWIGCKLSTEF